MTSNKPIISVLVLFLAAFDPQIPFFPNGIGFTFLIVVLLFPLVFLNINSLNSHVGFFLKKSNPYFIAFALSLAFIMLRIIFNEGINIEFIFSWAKAFFVFLACLFTYLVFYSSKSVNAFISSLLTVYIINAIINFIAGTYPELFSFLSVFRVLEISQEVGLNPYRNSFISGSGYYSIGTAYGLAVLLFCLHLTNSNKNNIAILLSISFISITAFIAARTAFFAILFASLYVFKSRLVYFLFLGVMSGILIYFVIDLPALEPYRLWMLSFFDLANDNSGSVLINQMYFWPGDEVFLIGTGAANDGKYTYTDSGYMIDILFGGIFFLIIKLSFLMIFIVKFIRFKPLFTIMFSLAILLFHFKGLFLYNNAQGMAAFYFTFFYLISIRKQMSQKGKVGLS